MIIGFGMEDVSIKRLYDYEHDNPDLTLSVVTNISPYLIEGHDLVVVSRSRPICDVPDMVYGSKPTDGGNLIIDESERASFAALYPLAAKYLRPFVGGDEFLNGRQRYCLWLKDASPAEIRKCPELLRRVEAVKTFRLASKKEATRRDAIRPALFAEIRQPKGEYLAVPEVSSERREYIPMGLLPESVICSNKLQRVERATVFHFGILTSRMHMAWVKQVCGRLESRYDYSSSIVYNNYPWPEAPTPAQKAAVEKAAQAVLDARAGFPCSTLADLYDPLAMPAALAAAHTALDKAVDKCYRDTPFPSDRARVEYLFALYEKLTAPLAATGKAKTKRPRKAATPDAPPQGKSTPQSEADAAHFYFAKEEPPPYRTN